MKILFISAGGNTQDYLRDVCFHGLRSILGPDVVDVGRLDSMYVGADRSQMYGKGMTLYAELPDIQVDRSDIPKKISKKYFDLVIFGSIHRCRDFYHEVTTMYPPERVVALDGEDHPGVLAGLPMVYFKRELHNPYPGVHPIQFGIPKEKILTSPPQKTRLMAPMDPLDKSTYIYKSEESYYAQYAESYYATTMMKAGWDCLRHYEILSQWCIPFFRSLNACPPTIMDKMPKFALYEVQRCFDFMHSHRRFCNQSAFVEMYSELIEGVMKTVRNHLTTETIATYVLDTVGVTVCS